MGDQKKESVDSRTAAEFEHVFNNVAAPLRAYLRRSTSTPDADDLLQETFIRFLQSSKSSQLDMLDSRKYIFRIATNLLKDHWRAEERKKKLEDTLRIQHADIDDQEDVYGMRLEMDRALGALNERERAMLWLAHAEDYTHREIATIFGIQPASVRVLLYRARRKLAAAINK